MQEDEGSIRLIKTINLSEIKSKIDRAHKEIEPMFAASSYCPGFSDKNCTMKTAGILYRKWLNLDRDYKLMMGMVDTPSSSIFNIFQSRRFTGTTRKPFKYHTFSIF